MFYKLVAIITSIDSFFPHFICRRKRFKLGGTDKDTLEEELSAIANLNRVMASQAPAPPPPPPPMPAALPPMLPPRPFLPPPPSSLPYMAHGNGVPPIIPPIDLFALRSSMAAPPTTPPSATVTSPSPPPQSSKPKKKGGFNIDSLIETPEEEAPVKPAPLLPPVSRAWPPFYPAVDAPTSAGPYPPFLPNFHLQAAANLHMAAMAALAAQQSSAASAHQQNSSEVPFLEVPREEAGPVSSHMQQLSPTARSDISSCSSTGSSGFNSLHGDLVRNNNTSPLQWGQENSNFKMSLDHLRMIHSATSAK